MQIHILMFEDNVERASVDALKICDLADAMNGDKDILGPYSVVSVELEDALLALVENSTHERKKSTDEEFESFWQPIIFNKRTGELNLEQLKKELYDYSMLIGNVPKVYSEVSGGKISKPNTDPSCVIEAFNDLLNETVDEAIEEYKESQEQ